MGHEAFRYAFDGQEPDTTVGACLIDKMTTHHASGQREEMSSVLPIDIFGFGQSQERLINKGGGLEDITRALTAKTVSRDSAQIGHQRCKQLVSCRLVTRPPLPQQDSDLPWVSCHCVAPEG